MNAQDPHNLFETEPADFEVGQLVGGKYKIVALLGKGGMGSVYEVEQIFLDTKLALKVLDRTKVQDGVQMRRFQQEARAAGSLQHPNLVKVHDFGLLDSGQPYLVMDLIQGETLDDFLKRNGPLSVAEITPLFAQICFGLSAAHADGIIHRDIKPKNIMLLDGALRGTEGGIKIIDFGIAKIAGGEGSEAQSLTRTGEVFGSPAYMSPEQCSGSLVDHRSDEYSLGCVLYEALTGTVPFAEESALQTMILHQSGRIPTLKEGNPRGKFTPDIEAVMAKLLAKAPSERFEDVATAAHELSIAAKGNKATTKGKGSFSQRKFKISNLQFVVLLLGTALLTSAATVPAAFWILKHQTAEPPLIDATKLGDKAEDNVTYTPHDEQTGGKKSAESNSSSSPSSQLPGGSNPEIADVTPRATPANPQESDSNLATLPQIVSSLELHDGKTMRKFIFPNGYETGKIEPVQSLNLSNEQNSRIKFTPVQARGTVWVPKDVPLAFSVDVDQYQPVTKHPEAFLAIGPDEFEAINLRFNVLSAVENALQQEEQRKITLLLMRAIGKWNKLKTMHLHHAFIDFDFLQAMSKMVKLEELQVTACETDPDGPRYRWEFTQRLKYFSCVDSRADDFLMQFDAGSKVETIILIRSLASSQCFHELRRCPTLAVLTLVNAHCDEQTMKQLALCRPVQYLTFFDMHVSTEHIERILRDNRELVKLYVSPEDLKEAKKAGIVDPRLQTNVDMTFK